MFGEWFHVCHLCQSTNFKHLKQPQFHPLHIMDNDFSDACMYVNYFIKSWCLKLVTQLWQEAEVWLLGVYVYTDDIYLDLSVRKFVYKIFVSHSEEALENAH